MRIACKPVDILSLYFIALLSVITIFGIPAIPAWKHLLAMYAVIVVAIISLAFYRTRLSARWGGFYFHPFSYVVIIPIIFNSLGDIIPYLRTGTFDGILIQIDFLLFKNHPTVWLEKIISPGLTALLQLAYTSYYFIPLSLVVILVIKKKEQELDLALFGITLCFYLSYVGYLLVPAMGPRFSLDHLQTISLQADHVIQSIQDIVNALEHNKTDAFPSGHTAIALLTLWYARKCRERVFFWLSLPVVILLIFSTVYLRYHYVIDVIAGILTTLLAIIIAPWTNRLMTGSSGQS
jgi:membrane-associated phospholipid phosphatase